MSPHLVVLEKVVLGFAEKGFVLSFGGKLRDLKVGKKCVDLLKDLIGMARILS